MKKTLAFLFLVLGLCLLLYPALGSGLSRLFQQDALARYRSAVRNLSPEACQRLLEAAETRRDPGLLSPEETGIIGSVAIPGLEIQLPIYPGTEEGYLRQGAGLLEGTSLPLGGDGCHSVLAAHSGLPEARLFRDLGKLKIGDSFTVTVLDRTMHYTVDRITVADPWDTGALMPEEGKDLCTLLTCTPWGINSHRLLVRGIRRDPP